MDTQNAHKDRTGKFLVRENPTPDWLFYDDFEEDRFNRYFAYTQRSQFFPVSGEGLGGGRAMKAEYRAADGEQHNTGGLQVFFGRTPDDSVYKPAAALGEDLREVYTRYYVKHEKDWAGGGGGKMSRITSIQGTGSWTQSMIAHTWSDEGAQDEGRNYLTMDPASGIDIPEGTNASGIRGAGDRLITTTYNDFPRLNWLGGKRPSKVPIFDAVHVGQWYLIEIHVRLNDPGQRNGVFEMWIDEDLQGSLTDINWIGSYEIGEGKGYGINAFFLENYCNKGVPKDQARVFDHLVISRQRIGPAAFED